MLADGYNSALWVEMIAGNFDAAHAMAREGKRLGESIDSLWGYAGASSSIAVVYLEQGEIGRAIGDLTEVSRRAKAADVLSIVYFGLPYLVLAYLTSGSFEQADQFANELYAERDALVAAFRGRSLAIGAEVKVRTGQLELARRILAEAFDSLEQGATLFDAARLSLADAYLQLALDRPQRALERMESLIGRMRQAGARLYLPEALFVHGIALLALNEPESARDVFMEAKRVGEKTGAQRMLWQILWELSRLETSAGNSSDAILYRAQAQEIVGVIAGHSPPDVRASFLALPEVRAVSQHSPSRAP